MKLVLVAWQFPPANTIAAVRLGKLARFLLDAGHDLRVITAARTGGDRSLAVEIPEELVERTPFLDVDRLFDPRQWWRRRPDPKGQGAATPGGGERNTSARPMAAEPAGWRRRASELYTGLTFFPDRQVGWGRHLVPALRRAIDRFHPDLVLVSGPPFSSFVWTAQVCGRAGVPWVAEFRDRWADDTYTTIPSWRRPIDRRLEHRTVRSAAGIVTVSEPWRAFFAARYAKPTLTVMNGFDPADFASLAAVEPEPGLPLTVLHVGTIYRGRRDPTALFRALREGGFAAREVRVVFYGLYLEWVDELARALEVRELVELHPPVPYREALALQARADLLLLLQWNAPGEGGNVPGKLFEYFATGRPMIGLGPEDGVPAKLINERNAGLFSNDPNALAAFLRARLDEKRQGGVAPLPPEARAGFTRVEQYRELERFLGELRARYEQPSMTNARVTGVMGRKSRRPV